MLLLFKKCNIKIRMEGYVFLGTITSTCLCFVKLSTVLNVNQEQNIILVSSNTKLTHYGHSKYSAVSSHFYI